MAALAIAGFAFAAWRLFVPDDGGASFEYDFVTAGLVEKTVTASGALRPRRLIQIGAEVSGKILALDADFNQQVEEGQRLALIDSSEIEAQIASLEADLERAKGMRLQAEADLLAAKAERIEAERDFERSRSLQDKGVVPEQAIEQIETRVARAKAAVLRAKAALRIADADITSAEAALTRARVNLARTVIRSPVAGSILNRAVEVGQTLTSSFQTPLLYEIAAGSGDLVLEARVDEADIGGVMEGQPVSFTVDSFPDTRFTGTVEMVRHAPVISDNITSYPVIIAVSATDGRLYPGMTAMVQIVIAHLEKVMRVPNRALAFDPDSSRRSAGNHGVSVVITDREGAERLKREGSIRERIRSGKIETGTVVWKRDAANSDGLRAIVVKPLLRGDGFTAIETPELKPGDRIAVGIKVADER